MKKKLLALLFGFLAGPLLAQSTHSVVLTWTASVDTGGSVNVYRLAGACPSTVALSSFTNVKTGVAAAGPFTDAEIAVGQYCYVVTSVVGGAESLPSNAAAASVLPKSPTTLVAVPD